MSTGNRRKQKFPRRAAWTTVAVLSSCLGVAWGAPVGPTTSPTASTFSAILLAPCPAPGTSTPGGTGGGNGACPPESCCIRNSAMAEAQVSLAQCQPTASPQPCKTFHGLCSQTAVAHYSMVNIAQRLDNLVKQLPASSASSACSTTAAAQKLANEMTDALISNDVYHSHAQHYLPSFVQRIPNTDTLALGVLGIHSPTLLSDPATGFYASVYKNLHTGQYIVANRGTVISPWHPVVTSRDLSTDIRQALGYPTPVPRQYGVDATNLGSALAKSHQQNVVLTGHSLGGGLAALEARLTGDPAITFDSAGVSQYTLNTTEANSSANIINMEVNGQFLGQMQGHSLRSDFSCALRTEPGTTSLLLYAIAQFSGVNFSQAMKSTTILPRSLGQQVVLPLTHWSSTSMNSETAVTPSTGTCLANVVREATVYHKADMVVHALNYELTQLVCPKGKGS